MPVSKRNKVLPRTLWVAGMKGVLIRKQLLRHIPGKREVWLADYDEQQVIVKNFYQQKNAEREIKNFQLLKQANIPTAELIHHGWLSDKKAYVLVFEKIAEAHNLENLWFNLTNNQRELLLKELMIIFASLHQAGLTHTDPHLKNFLVKDEQIFLIDIASFIQNKSGQALSVISGLKNLGFLLAQLSSTDEESFTKLCCMQYLNACRQPFTLARLSRLEKYINTARSKRLQIYGKKVFRSTSALQKYKNWYSLVIWDRNHTSNELNELLNDPNKALLNAENLLLKVGNTCTVGQVTINGQNLVIKRYNIKNFWHGLKKCCRMTRAAIAWRNAHYLNLVNIPTAKPVALVEKRFGPLRLTSYFIYEFIPGNKLNDYFSIVQDKQQIKQTAAALIQLLDDLKKMRISHGDLKATNILINENNQPTLLDLDAARLHTNNACWKRAWRRDQQRFMKNWESEPEILNLFSAKHK